MSDDVIFSPCRRVHKKLTLTIFYDAARRQRKTFHFRKSLSLRWCNEFLITNKTRRTNLSTIASSYIASRSESLFIDFFSYFSTFSTNFHPHTPALSVRFNNSILSTASSKVLAYEKSLCFFRPQNVNSFASCCANLRTMMVQFVFHFLVAQNVDILISHKGRKVLHMTNG